MIRRSYAIAGLALVLSVLVHTLLLRPAALTPSEPTVEDTTDVVALGNAFEDVAETTPEPVEPETAPTPEPPLEATPEPEPVSPTSDAQVASAEPQEVTSPGTGAAEVVEPITAESVVPETSAAPAAEAVEPVETEQAAAPEPQTQPVESEPVSETAEAPAETAEPVEPVIAEPVSPSAPVAPEQLAALPLAPTPEPSPVPVIPLEPEVVEPEPLETTVEPAPDALENPDTEDTTNNSELAVVSSLRPRLPVRRPSTDQNTPTELDSTQPEADQLIESPLLAYRRNKTDLNVRGFGSAFGGSLNSLGTPGSGNATATNYAGRVLIQLNSARAVSITALGWARVYFEINSDGSLARVDVIESTGSQELEEAAKAQVRAAAPFPPPPPGASRTMVFMFRKN